MPEPKWVDWRTRSEPPRLLCCKPRWVPFPSGHAWTHSDRCKAEAPEGRRRRGQKVTDPPDGPWLELPPAGSATATWRAHPPGHQCEACRYVEAHLDDEDDDGRPLPSILEKEDPHERRAD